jgi:cysteine desulfurase
MIYLDSNATTRPDDAVVRAMNEALVERWHNPSSMHRAGQAAKAKVEQARVAVARLVNAEPGEIVLTSGGTEAIDMAIRGATALGRRAGKTAVVSTPIEHAVARYLLRALEREGVIELREAPVTRAGVLDLEKLPALLDERVALVNVQWANNETGAVQPVQRVGALVRQRCPGALLHVDGCQWVGKTPTDVRSDTPRAGGAMIDLLSIAAQKFHGPKGAGALFVRRGVPLPTQTHGSQESGRRGGTENVPGVVGMGVAADLARRWLEDPANLRRLGALRDRFERGVLERVQGSVVNAGESERLENTTNIAFPGADAEALLMTLSERGVCASAGAACSSGSMEPSPILRAMGVPPDLAMGSVRFSLSKETTEREVDEAISIVAGVVESVRANAPLLRL